MNEERVWIIDTSALLRAKQVVPAASQWRLFKLLEELVESQKVFFPKQVRDELSGGRYIDTPEAWALHVSTKIAFAYEPDIVFIQEVMAVASDVVDVDAERDRADPYVLAQCLELAEMQFSPCIVTEDVIDRMPIKISIRTACERLHLEHCMLADFLAAIDFA